MPLPRPAAATVALVASAVGDRTVLDLLAALTEADGLATGPSAWSGWKAGLVADLVGRVGATLAGVEPAQPTDVAARHAERIAAGRVVVELSADGGGLLVVAPDRPGLLWRVAGALALHRLDVRSAALGGRDGWAVQEMRLEPSYGAEPDRELVTGDVRRAIAGRLALDARVAQRARAAARRAPVPAAPPAVAVDNEASSSATVVEVHAADGVGVLYRIARALCECDLDVRSAKVSTLGHEVVDTFYVVDSSGAKLLDDDHVAEVRRAVLGELSR